MILTAKESLKIQERFGYSVQELDQIILAIKNAKSIFDLAYSAAEKGFNDEVLLHCGIGSARMSKFDR